MTVNTVKGYLSKTSGCAVYAGYPDISKRDEWEAFPIELKREIVKRGEEALLEPWSELLVSDFREFFRSGNRVRFEDKYFSRRRKLNSLVMAECVQNKGRFIDAILDGLYLIMEESSWCLPPHNSHVRDGQNDAMPNVARPVIDLFDAESGAEVAFCEYLLRPVFEKISPNISEYVNYRLEERIFVPFLNEHFWWMGNGKEPMCNWTPWCTQNVLICALTRSANYFDEDKRRKFLEKAAASCDYFLDEYGEDGCCNEGAQYYSHAALCLFGCLELMAGVTGEAFAGIYSEKLIKNMANYIVKMHVAGDTYINFADCSAHPGRRGAREFLFGKRTGDDVLAGFAAEDLKSQSMYARLIPDEINLFYHVMQAFAYKEMTEYKGNGDNIRPKDSWFESTGLMVARDNVYTLAAKAGNNADSHNHNDVGSFTIYKDGKPFVIDLGVGTYTEKTFSERRYEIWTMQSKYHNLPTFTDESGAEIMQKPGAEYVARSVKCELGDAPIGKTSGEGSGEVCSLSMDIASAYGDERIGSYHRIVTLNKGEDITVTDKYDGELKAFVSIMTYEKPVSDEHGMRISVGELGCIDLSGGVVTDIEECPINDARLSMAWKHSVYRVVIEIDDAHELSLLIR
ncbi:heparinase [Butyrivibrio sp. X503]|uniref:heparinase II/III domain-containing protein n=1 Tax=Butyrivibrio sp. X503 TaxID=2364878 RepID=UPI000EA9F259|nr:heparinase II/III family protein [Butyrivibrio sp. X503]RKM57997.1 heparinase [Butyrivibrio sp. X503]